MNKDAVWKFNKVVWIVEQS